MGRTKLDWFLCIAITLAGIFTMARADEKKSYELTEDQKLRLQGQQSAFASAQDRYQQAVRAFNAEIKAIEKENGFPETLVFNPTTLTFSDPPAPPAAPAAPGLSKPTGPPAEPAKKP